jgi:hypothetical protein
MDSAIARNIAYANHRDQRDRSGRLLVEHLERVASSVDDEVLTVAYLHDLLERTDTPVTELEADGLTPVEHAALMLLTRGATESFELHALRIAYAKGPEGRIARAVKLADVDDHIANDTAAGSVPYGWARRHIVTCQGRLDAPARVSSAA